MFRGVGFHKAVVALCILMALVRAPPRMRTVGYRGHEADLQDDL